MTFDEAHAKEKNFECFAFLQCNIFGKENNILTARMNRKLFEGSDESDEEDLQISTNKEYAKSYNSFRKKELLKKCK